MASVTEICNLALSHISISKEISNVDTENSASAAACRRFYTDARDETFRDFNWPFATKFASLGLVEEDPNTDWQYSYRYPSDCRRIRKILSGVRNDSRQSRVRYEVASDDDGKLIFTDEQNAVLKYTRIIDDVALFTVDYKMMLSLLLAAYIAPRLTGGDPFKLGEKAWNIYLGSKMKAQANSLNEQEDDEEVDSEFIRARE